MLWLSYTIFWKVSVAQPNRFAAYSPAPLIRGVFLQTLKSNAKKVFLLRGVATCIMLQILLNVDVLVRFNVLAFTHSTAGPLHFEGFDNRIVVYAEDSGEFTL